MSMEVEESFKNPRVRTVDRIYCLGCYVLMLLSFLLMQVSRSTWGETISGVQYFCYTGCIRILVEGKARYIQRNHIAQLMCCLVWDFGS